MHKIKSLLFAFMFLLICSFERRKILYACFFGPIIFYEKSNGHTCGRLHPAHTRGSASVCKRINLGMFLVPRRTGLVCGHSPGRPHGRFTTREGLVCGRSAVRPHATFHARTRASVWAFVISPTRPSPLPHPSC